MINNGMTINKTITTIGAMCGDFDLEVIRVFEKAKNTIGTYSRVIRYKLNAVKLRGSDE